MAELGAPSLVFNLQLKGTAKVPTRVMQLCSDIDREKAVNYGIAGEDDSRVYSLSVYPPARVLELNLHEIRSHEFLHPDQNVQMTTSAPPHPKRSGHSNR